MYEERLADNEFHGWAKEAWTVAPLHGAPARRSRKRGPPKLDAEIDAIVRQTKERIQLVEKAALLQLEVLQLAEQLRAIRKYQTVDLEMRIQALEAKTVNWKPVEVALKELSSAELRKQVLEYYRAHSEESLYPSDVAGALSVDALAVFEMTNVLVGEGVLK